MLTPEGGQGTETCGGPSRGDGRGVASEEGLEVIEAGSE